MNTLRSPRSFKSSKLSAVVLALFLGCIVLSCKKPSNNDTPELQSAVNVVNATIGMKQVGFFINNSKIQGDPLSYTDESGYFLTSTGSRSFNAIEELATDYFLKSEVVFKPNTYHTIFMAGEAGSMSSLFTEDDLTAPTAGKAKIRFVHLSPDGGSLMLSLKTGAALFPEQAYKTASAFQQIDPGVYDLVVKSSGGTVLVERKVTVTAGMIYTAWVKGLIAGTNNSPIGLQFRSIN